MNFWNRGSLGDIIYSLPTIIAFGGGNLYTKTEWNYNSLKKILSLQDYIHNFNGIIITDHNKNYYWIDKDRSPDTSIPWGELIDTNLDALRQELRKCKDKKHIAQCCLDAFNAKYDLSQSWLENIEPQYQANIVINRTIRYHDKQEINWKLLNKYEKECVFIGNHAEYKHFMHYSQFKIMRHQCQDLLEFAQVIKGSKLYIGNQSAGFALAEAMKHPRVLEVFHPMPNCMPHGKDGHTFLTEALIDKYIMDKEKECQ